MLLQLGDVEGAIAANREGIQRDPDNETAFYNLSLALQVFGDYGEAVQAAQRATQLDPQNPHPWVALANAYDLAGDRAQAQVAYRRALALDSRYRDPSFVATLVNYGFTPILVENLQRLRGSL